MLADLQRKPDREEARDATRQSWLPPGKLGAICFSIDDVHPSRTRDGFDAGGDLGEGALGRLEYLLQRHPWLQCTLFVTPDWRQRTPRVERRLLSRIPILRNRIYHARPLPQGTMRIDRHAGFVEYLQGLPRVDVALHGLHHVRRGPSHAVEFLDLDRAGCQTVISDSVEIFEAAQLPFSPGLCPPVWHFSPQLGEAMVRTGLRFIASARDVDSPIRRDAVTAMSGLRGVSLIQPQFVHGGDLLHFTTNFQATSPLERALAIIDSGGLLCIKAHVAKHLGGHVHLDGLDDLYANYLDLLFFELERRYGAALWWTSMWDITRRIRPEWDVAESAAA